METVFEKVQIKRKWGQYEAHHVNSSTPVRDRMIQWVGERRVTEEELKQYLSSIQEERGKSPDMNWFTRNGRFFEQTTHRGQDVYTLSKYGKRVLEAIKCQKGEKNKKQINENWGTIQMKNLKTFEQFLNESNQIQALSNDFGGYDNSKFLRISWHLGIGELEHLLKVTSSDLKFTKAHSKGVLGAFNRKDSQFLKSRIEFLNQIIASKKSDPSYIPDAYKNK